MDSSYLLEILTTGGVSGDDYVPDVNAKITDIIQRINILKRDVKNVMEDSHSNFNLFLKDNELLQEEALKLTNRMNDVKQNVSEEIKPEIATCRLELENLSESLLDVNMSLNILQKLLDFHTALKNVNSKMKSGEYHECSEIIMSLREKLNNECDNIKNLEIFKVFSEEVIISYEQLLHVISEVWSTNIELTVKEADNFKVVNLHINTKSYKELAEILKASDRLKNRSLGTQFSKKIMTNLVNEIILGKVEITELDGETATLSSKIFIKEKKPHYVQVFDNLNTLFQFLSLHLFQNLNSYNFLELLGKSMAEEFTKNLIDNCLADTIPTNSKDLEKYQEVVNRAELFETSLHECKFLTKNCTSLMDYARNINVLFANKFCQSYLSKAKIIMKKDLHTLTTSAEIVLDQLDVLPHSQKIILKEKLNCSENVIRFPNCQISKSAVELLNLVHDVMSEVVKNQDLCAVRLFYTVRNIFEMYCAVVPLHHKKFLDTLPQHVAIFHNNCLYFTHQLVNITCEYKQKVPGVLKDHFSIFLDEAVSLRTLAKETLELHMSNQSSQIIFILRDSGLATLNEEPELDPTTEKKIRQCIRQLQILQTVWHGILPVNVYNRAMGFLLDATIEELIQLILGVLDIASKTASVLVDLFTIIQEKAPKLFVEPREVVRHSRKWQRFGEFIFLLKGSLFDIDQRWMDGMGPLANEFPAEQVRHLIRALFQNSEKRAALLAKIK